MANANSAGAATAVTKASARVAAIGLGEPGFSILGECFHQYGIDFVAIPEDAADLLRHEKFEACVLELTPEVLGTMAAIRSSPLNRRSVIYGVLHVSGDALPFIKYGVNAILKWPFDHEAANKVIRATQALVIHEFRRYVRVPVTTEVAVRVDGQKVTAYSEEISAGGMSIKVPQKLLPSSAMLLSFVLPSNKKVTVTATVCWARDEDSVVGVCFGPADERRLQVQAWIDQYLQSA